MKLGQLIRTGGLALALAASGTLAGCDDDDPVAGPKDGGGDASTSDGSTTDGTVAGDTAKPDGSVSPDATVGGDTADGGADATDVSSSETGDGGGDGGADATAG